MDTDLPLVIKKVDMPKEMKLFTIKAAKLAFEKCTKEEEIAAFLQSIFNHKYGPLWSCLVGTNFGAHVTFENRRYIYFYVGMVGVILFKNGTVMHDIQIYRKACNKERAKAKKEEATENGQLDVADTKKKTCTTRSCKKKKPPVETGSDEEIEY